MLWWASHEAALILLSKATAENLIMEGGDVSNEQLNEILDCLMYMEQPMDSSGKMSKRVRYVNCPGVSTD